MNALPHHIMVVDDHEDIRELIATFLSEEGYNTRIARNGQEALAQLEIEGAELLITDILMPIMDGVELCMKVQKSIPEIKILLISGGGRQFKGSKDFDYLKSTNQLVPSAKILKKPFTNEQLLEIVRELLIT